MRNDSSDEKKYVKKNGVEVEYDQFLPTGNVRYGGMVYKTETKWPCEGQFVMARYDDFAYQIKEYDLFVCRGLGGERSMVNAVFIH